MFAIDTLVRRPNGDYAYHNGKLVGLPAELRGNPRLAEYLNIQRPGWIVGTFGYQIYTHLGSGGETYIFPGLIIDDGPKITKKFYGHGHKFTKLQIEEFASSIVSFGDGMKAIAQNDFNLLIHDLRGISNSLYNAAEEARHFASIKDEINVQVRIENIIAAQTILRIRTDALDFVGNAAPLLKDEEIAVFRKVDKVCRSFKPRAWDENKQIDLSGPSSGLTLGPQILEVVPYTLIDNALKYANKGASVQVQVQDRDDHIRLSVTSPGPRIEPAECEAIFGRGVRSSAAVATGVPGSGLGLHIVAKIVQQYFGGTVSVDQRASINTIDGVERFETEFLVQFPTLPVKLTTPQRQVRRSMWR